MKTLKSIKVMSVFKMSLVLGSVVGLLYGTILAISSFIRKDWTEGALTLVLAPIIYGVLGGATNALMSWLYNRFAERIGGIEIDLE